LKKLFVVGDSISVHYGPHLARMVDGLLEYARKEAAEGGPSVLPYPADANGGDSGQVLAYLEEKLDEHAPDILLLNCGLHDLRTDPQTEAKQVPLGAYQGNLNAIVRLVKGRDTLAVWVRTTPVDDERHNARQVGFRRFNHDVVRYNEVADRVFGEAGVPLVDLYTYTYNLGGDVFCDHVHFVERVRELQAAFVAGHLFALCGEQPKKSNIVEE
jgi:lysophospholipase L1-like esterase